MKKIAIAVVSVFVLAGCGGEDAGADADAEPKATPTTPTGPPTVSEDQMLMNLMRDRNLAYAGMTDAELQAEADSVCDTVDQAGGPGPLFDAMMASGSDIDPGFAGAIPAAIKWRCPEWEDEMNEWAASR
jgi:hypothetical protein